MSKKVPNHESKDRKENMIKMQLIILSGKKMTSKI